jgi:hypothetical protein
MKSSARYLGLLDRDFRSLPDSLSSFLEFFFWSSSSLDLPIRFSDPVFFPQDDGKKTRGTEVRSTNSSLRVHEEQSLDEVFFFFSFFSSSRCFLESPSAPAPSTHHPVCDRRRWGRMLDIRPHEVQLLTRSV